MTRAGPELTWDGHVEPLLLRGNSSQRAIASLRESHLGDPVMALFTRKDKHEQGFRDQKGSEPGDGLLGVIVQGATGALGFQPALWL